MMLCTQSTGLLHLLLLSLSLSTYCCKRARLSVKTPCKRARLSLQTQCKRNRLINILIHRYRTIVISCDTIIYWYTGIVQS